MWSPYSIPTSIPNACTIDQFIGLWYWLSTFTLKLSFCIWIKIWHSLHKCTCLHWQQIFPYLCGVFDIMVISLTLFTSFFVSCFRFLLYLIFFLLFLHKKYKKLACLHFNKFKIKFLWNRIRKVLNHWYTYLLSIS